MFKFTNKDIFLRVIILKYLIEFEQKIKLIWYIFTKTVLAIGKMLRFIPKHCIEYILLLYNISTSRQKNLIIF